MKGERPSLRHFLDEAPAPLRSRAFEDLLQIEIDHRRDEGENPATRDYLDAFREHGEIIERLLGRVDRATDAITMSDTVHSMPEQLQGGGTVALPVREV